MESHVIDGILNTGHLKSHTQSTTENTQPAAVLPEAEKCPQEWKEGAD
jgi:hypothetical protein